MSLSNYTISIPDTATIADTWSALHKEADKYPWSMLEPKYGGHVIEVDGEIKLAMSDELSKQINDKMAAIPPATDDEYAEQMRRERHLLEHHMPDDVRERWKKDQPDQWAEMMKWIEREKEANGVDDQCKLCKEGKEVS